MEISGERVKITPLTLEDAHFMKNWGIHKNTLLSDYNLTSFDYEEIKEWHEYKTKGKNQIYYSVLNEKNRPIGYMGIKNIRRILKDAVLGIAFDPNYVNQGYGTDSIITFLDYYFNHMKMRKMFLEVAEFNKIAIRCYKKCGFEIVDRYIGEFFNQRISSKDFYYKEEESSFMIKDGIVYNYIYKMKTDKSMYFKAREDIDRSGAKNKTRSIID